MTPQRTFQNMKDYVGHDHAGTHRSTAGTQSVVERGLTGRDLRSLNDMGYVILEDLIDPQQLELMRAEAAPHLSQFGRNDLEGALTKRVYSVMAKTQACNPLAEHPRLLSLLDELLLPNYLLSMFQIIEIHPGEKAQLLHHDDAFYPIPRPRQAFGIGVILAVDEFTEENGATVLIPGSHRWGSERVPTEADQLQPAVMKAGSVLVMSGTLWHGGGANASQAPRLAVSCQYCEPWARTQENMFLAVPREIVEAVSPSLQRLLGYSIHAPFMGNVNGLSPLRVLSSV
jgi:ectoine hydroxylase-related dioxygenase (phytanoyl-CoA dioxygenase family)